MLKKMRWRFIGAAMIAFTAVVLTLLGCVNIWNYWNITTQLDNTLTILYEVGESEFNLVFQEGAPPRGETGLSAGAILTRASPFRLRTRRSA